MCGLSREGQVFATEARLEHHAHDVVECDLIAINCRNHARLLAGEFGDAGEPWPGFNDDLALVLAEREAA